MIQTPVVQRTPSISYIMYTPSPFMTVRYTNIPIRKCQNEPRHEKTNKVTMRPAKTQISLGIRPVWSESSLCAQWVAKDHAESEDSDQTGRMPRLIWVRLAHTHFVGLSCCGSNHRSQQDQKEKQPRYGAHLHNVVATLVPNSVHWTAFTE